MHKFLRQKTKKNVTRSAGSTEKLKTHIDKVHMVLYEDSGVACDPIKVPHHTDRCGDHIAYFAVQSLAVASCCCKFVFSIFAISGTSGSPGFGSVSREHTDSNTFEIVNAGDH
jgi:hypothetical protein